MSNCFSGVTNHAKKISQMFVGVEKQIIKNFSYTGTIQEFIAPKKGTYKLEVWGAQGGSSEGRTSDMSSLRMFYGGYGGYSVGEVELEENDKLYIVIGQQPGTGRHVNPSYNGGGGSNGSDSLCNFGGGGGATHIAKVTGVLSELENNIDDILIVAGGGSGALSYYAIGYRQSSGCCTGCSGGGYAGSYMTKMNNSGNQTTGYSFGKGSGESASYAAGGGGGFYGGHGGYSTCGSGNGGGGSGYIANPLLTNKKMCVCITDGNYAWSGYAQAGDMSYVIPTSDEPDIKTVRVDDSWHSSTATSEYAKEGHGYARITYTDGVATKIKKAFTSVNGIAKKIY